MSFASPLPTWLLVAAVGGVGALAYLAYAKTSQALSPTARWFLRSLRAASLLTLLILVMRPVRITPSLDFSRAVVPILIDRSASMALPVASGGTRIDRAVDAVRSLLDAKLGDRFSVEVLGYEDRVAPLELDRVEATGRRSDLQRALQIVRERYRDRQVAGIVLLTDGADTSPGDMHVEAGPPVFTIGFGDARIAKDREVVDVTVGQPSIGGAVVDLSATIVSHGFGHEPFDVRVFEGERLLQVRKVTAAGDGAPVREVFRVSPKADAPTSYAVEVVADHAELTDANNRQSVLVQPEGRPRRVLIVEGGPGFEHSFLKRALATDPHMEVDSVVRKGRNESNQDTFLIQAASGRTAGLSRGYPTERELLFSYDAIVLANIEGDFFSRDQFTETAAFVAERGGGLLVMGGQSFERGGLRQTPVEEVLPLELLDRSNAPSAADGPVFRNRVALTTEGERHPVMRLGASPEDSLKSWAEMPALAASVSLGAARPGAAVLAVTSGPGGASRPLLAVQPYGRGRSMVFTGEGAWRWRMMLPSADKTYEAFWRQAVRWLTMDAPDPIGVRMPPLDVGEAGEILVDVRNPRYEPLADVSVSLTLTDSAGATRDLKATVKDAASGTFATPVSIDRVGIVRVDARATRGVDSVGTASAIALVGGRSTELSDPRRNDDVLSRIAAQSGGQSLRPDEIGRVPELLASKVVGAPTTIRQDLWHNPWTFAFVLTLLLAEWIARRRWGLR